MGLNFDNAHCLVPDCTREPTHELSLRMRRQDSGADWAPDTHAFFCAKHAVEGADVTILYRPNLSGEVDVTVIAVRRSGAVNRVTKIRRKP